MNASPSKAALEQALRDASTSHHKYEEDVLDSPLFHDIQIVITTDEKQRMVKVRAYEEKHGIKIF